MATRDAGRSAALKNDLVEVMLACANCELDQIELDWRDEWAVAVVLTSAGYPGSYEKARSLPVSPMPRPWRT
ncbi:MAG: hypothetical protein ACLU37_07095 [Collinsella sp.]